MSNVINFMKYKKNKEFSENEKYRNRLCNQLNNFTFAHEFKGSKFSDKELETALKWQEKEGNGKLVCSQDACRLYAFVGHDCYLHWIIGQKLSENEA